METIENELRRGDTRDSFDRELEVGRYIYRLIVTGDGKLGFKAKQKRPDSHDRSTLGRWRNVIEPKSKVRGGTELTGTFDVEPYSRIALDSQDEEETGRVKFIFTRKIGTRGVSYRLEYELGDFPPPESSAFS